ncbi:NAD(P)/FAD-dependent oxidoreductase [Phanerochaete sordida]|uniref:NAD(P)/FAD-dependent oxidoreductase n=1 Tax=Phanerochaete sordida TaxID=48140 RepID=A0A9P3G7M3_9APHY|nr:NAD(P)/FAD-dependent oxidoreductase [Phanerochaete sordida]
MPSTPTLSSQLPTFDIVGASPPEPVAAEDAARAWIGLFTACAVAGDTERLIHEALYTDPWWRDLFALTWDIRTFHGRAAISHFLHDRLAVTRFGGIELLKATYQTPYPALCWIVAAFSFKTDVAQGRGEARLVYCADRTWRAVAVYTNLEGVKDFPECLGPHRDFRPNHGRCPVGAVYSRSPDVLIIGGGQSGLAVAARLNALGVPNLVVEADERVGDRWRKRHEKLCLHGPIWQNHMPYLPFPSTWPVFTPAHKFASWLEFYADALDISVQTATSATSLHRNSDTQKWDVVLQSPNGVQNLLSVKHVVVAAGWPFKRVSLPGQDDFIGQVIHSTDFSSAEPYVGKKVVVIGACSSAHDAASDCADLGIDVTMHQRSRTFVMSIDPGMLRVTSSAEWESEPTEDIDHTKFALPVHLAKHLAKRTAAMIREGDRNARRSPQGGLPNLAG